MEREEIAEQVEVRENEAPGDDITLGERHDVHFNGHETGTLTVEYKPDGYRLDEDGLETLAQYGFFGEDDEPEEIVSELYWALVALLYPNSSYLDEPWNRLPLVVELESGAEDDASDWYASLGTYR